MKLFSVQDCYFYRVKLLSDSKKVTRTIWPGEVRFMFNVTSMVCLFRDTAVIEEGEDLQ
jgi:hypothetical protein